MYREKSVSNVRMPWVFPGPSTITLDAVVKVNNIDEHGVKHQLNKDI